MKKLTSKTYGIIALVSFLAAPIIGLLTVASFWGAYDCVGNNDTACHALDHATTKVYIGGGLFYIARIVFVVSLVIFVWRLLKKKP